MPLMDLAYTTLGGAIGAALTTYLSRNQERRQLRATVMQELHRVGAVRDGVCDIVPSRGRPASYSVGNQLLATERFHLTAVLDDGNDAERALREALSVLVVASLSAGVPRRVLDFAGGGEERRLQCEVIRLIDLRLGGVLGESLEELMTRCEGYRQATAQLLLRALWHPWQSRWRMHAHIRSLRREVAALHRMQETAMSILAQPENTDALVERLASHPDRDTNRIGNAAGPAA
ncbi:hypothetical protein ABT009_46270 [Streptomyces sp. NPDC002896]|uniref:hypothetical protein n=1 Tax=Streptomyces sp. NPDC002896 TaxID=3154438 RepID=UPI003324E831